MRLDREFLCECNVVVSYQLNQTVCVCGRYQGHADSADGLLPCVYSLQCVVPTHIALGPLNQYHDVPTNVMALGVPVSQLAK